MDNKELESAPAAEEKPLQRSNLEICPNCLEPNQADLANCQYCGMPLHPETQQPAPTESAAEQGQSEIVSDPATGETAEAKPVVSERPKKKEPNKTWTFMMRGFGIYIIYYAISQMPQALKVEDQKSRTLAILANVIYLVAGLMMAWPLRHDIKRWLDKQRGKTAESSAPQTEGTSETGAAPESDIAEKSETDNTPSDDLPEPEPESTPELTPQTNVEKDDAAADPK